MLELPRGRVNIGYTGTRSYQRQQCYPRRMNCRISETNLRGVCRELIRSGRPVSHRALRQVLHERFGATGKTARVLRGWREESALLAAATKRPNDRQIG